MIVAERKPKVAITKPATMAVYKPCSGETPDAIASAIESGKAIIATITPAITSFKSALPL